MLLNFSQLKDRRVWIYIGLTTDGDGSNRQTDRQIDWIERLIGIVLGQSVQQGLF